MAARKTFYLPQGKYLLKVFKSPAKRKSKRFAADYRPSLIASPRARFTFALQENGGESISPPASQFRQLYFSTPKRNTVVWCMVAPGFSSVLGNDG
jgi:hypothetical protein